MVLHIEDLRILLDQQTEKLVSGLKDRSRYVLNEGVFTNKFSEGLTWFQYRLKGEQNLDSEFGRYEFPDQHPVLFKKQDLSRPIMKRDVPASDLAEVHKDRSLEIIRLYKEFLPEICKNKEDELTYGEAVKLDVNNVLSLQERVYDTGRKVAEYKLQKDDELHEEFDKQEKDERLLRGAKLIYITDSEVLSWRLINEEREKKVIGDFIKIGENYDLPNLEALRGFARKIIDLTVKVQVDYIQMIQEREGIFVKYLSSPWASNQRKQRLPEETSNSRGWTA